MPNPVEFDERIRNFASTLEDGWRHFYEHTLVCLFDFSFFLFFFFFFFFLFSFLFFLSLLTKPNRLQKREKDLEMDKRREMLNSGWREIWRWMTRKFAEIFFRADKQKKIQRKQRALLLVFFLFFFCFFFCFFLFFLFCFVFVN